MRTDLVLTLIGDDRPGLVEEVSETVAEYGGNWQQGSMSRLAGKFAGILRVSVEEDDADRLIEALFNLPDLRLTVERVDPGSGEGVGDERNLRLSLVGNDRAGIVRDISRTLARQGVNLERLNTECQSAPMSADTLFHATAELKVPATVDADALQEELERLADDLIVDLSIEDLDR